MTLQVTINGSTILHPFAATGITLPSRADGGAVSFGGIPFQDVNGDLSFNGLRRVTVEETACSQPRLFTGFIEARRIGRSPDAGLLAGTLARLVDTTLVDTNAVFGFRVISGSDGRRPEETWNTRLTWLLGSYYLRDLVANDTTYCLSLGPTWIMDATDYIGRYPYDVLNDLAGRLVNPVNYFAFWDPGNSDTYLFLDYQDAATFDSTISISNAIGEANGTTVFAPSRDALLERSPEAVYSSVLLTWGPDGKRIFRQRAATAAAYTLRGTTHHRPYTRKQSTATDQAENFLRRHAVETDRIRCSIIVPASRVGLILAGHRVSTKFTHLPGYSSAQSLRVIECTPQPLDDAAEMWELHLVLAYPRPAGAADPGGGAPSVVQHKSASNALTPVAVTLDAAPTEGNLLIYWHTMRGTSNTPTAPSGWTQGPDGTISNSGSGGGVGAWFYKVAGAGESATIQTAGSNVGNRATVFEIAGYTDIDTSAEATNITTGSGVALPATTVTPTQGAPIMLLAGLLNADSDTPGTTTTPPTGWTEVDDTHIGSPNVSPVHWAAYRSVTASGSYSLSSGSASYTEGLTTQVIALIGAADLDPGLEIGTWVINETPTPAADGTTTTFTLAYPFLDDSLTVRVDLLDQTPSVVSSDPAAGTFTLAFAPKVGEQVTADYQVGA